MLFIQRCLECNWFLRAPLLQLLVFGVLCFKILVRIRIKKTLLVQSILLIIYRRLK